MQDSKGDGNMPGDHLQDDILMLGGGVADDDDQLGENNRYSGDLSEEESQLEQDSEHDELIDAFNEHNKRLRAQQKLQMSYVTRLVGTSGKALDLEQIKDNSKTITSQLLEKRAEKRMKQRKGQNELLSSSSEDEHEYFRGK